jgi:hypothetical protein
MRLSLSRCVGLGAGVLLGVLTFTGGPAAASPAVPAAPVAHATGGGGGHCLSLGHLSKELTIDVRAGVRAGKVYVDAATGFKVQLSHVSWSGPDHKRLRFDFAANGHVDAVVAIPDLHGVPALLHLPDQVLGQLTAESAGLASHFGKVWSSVDLNLDLHIAAALGVSIDKIAFCWSPGPGKPGGPDTPPGGGDSTTTTSTTSTTAPDSSHPNPPTGPGSTTTSTTMSSGSTPHVSTTTTTESTSTGDLPRTGSTPGPLVAAGTGLLASGALVLAGTRYLRARRT